MTTPFSADTLSAEEFRRIADRQRWSLRELSERLGSLVLENVELMSIIQELQNDLAECRAVLKDLSVSANVMTPSAVPVAE